MSVFLGRRGGVPLRGTLVAPVTTPRVPRTSTTHAARSEPAVPHTALDRYVEAVLWPRRARGVVFPRECARGCIRQRLRRETVLLGVGRQHREGAALERGFILPLNRSRSSAAAEG